MVRAHTLTADPSYERYLGEDESSSVKDGDRILVPLQEIGTQYRQSWVQACIEKAGHWVVIARKEDISMEQVRVVVTGPFINFLLHKRAKPIYPPYPHPPLTHPPIPHIPPTYPPIP